MQRRPLLFVLFLAYIWLFSAAYTSAESAVLAYLSNSWQRTVGTVVQSTAEGPCSRSGGAIHKLLYSYKVGATAYSGTRKSFATESCDSETDSKRIAREYPVGSDLPVHFHPSYPNQSVVFPGQLAVRDYWQLGGLGLSLVLIPWGAWRYATRAA
jgi:hypothetical protein